MKWIAPIIAMITIAPGTASAALSEVVCDDTARLENQLSQVMGAQRQAQGLHAPDAVLQIWIVPRNGDWTLVQSYANGTSCILAMGEHWEALSADPA